MLQERLSKEYFKILVNIFRVLSISQCFYTTLEQIFTKFFHMPMFYIVSFNPHNDLIK